VIRPRVATPAVASPVVARPAVASLAVASPALASRVRDLNRRPAPDDSRPDRRSRSSG